MKVLVACEESQRVCSAFRALGHEAYSCDIIDCSGGRYEWHIKQDVLPLLNGNCKFTTADGTEHTVSGKWDLIIAHPPCTYLSNAGACRLYPKKGQLDQERYKKGLQAKAFFMKLYNADCEHIKGLPKLQPTKILSEYKPYVSCGTSKNKGNKDKAGFSRAGGAAKIRSKTFEGIAAAMAQQWGGVGV